VTTTGYAPPRNPTPPPTPASVTPTMGDGPGGVRRHRWWHWGPLLAAEVALAALTGAALWGFTQVFDGGDGQATGTVADNWPDNWLDNWWVPLVVVAVVAHAIPALARRREWGLATAALASVAGGIAAVVWLTIPGATVAGLPTTATPSRVLDAFTNGWEVFRNDVPPVPAEAGLVAAVGLAVVAGAFLADWAAFRLWSPLEASVPAVALFSFAALVGVGGRPVAAAAVMLAALGAFWVLHRQARLVRSARWMAAGPQSPLRPWATGAALVAVAVVAATVGGPALPGAGEPALVDLGDRGGDSRRVTVSPLVDIRGRLVNQSDQVAFTVASDRPEYWRLTSLEIFTGEVWRSAGNYQLASGELPGDGGPAPAAATTVTQRFDIAALGAPWLPAAWRPDAVDAPEAVRYHPESGTLMVDTEVPTADGFTYGVRSAVADLDAESLRSATVDGGVGLDDVYLSLPDDLSPVVARVARDVTTGATTPYDQARALQDYFAVNFTYDLDVPPGHGGDAIEAFLERGSGYCEQFAGTYAAMARTLGIPARVAVGFSPGDPDPDNPGTWVVRGRHAHAWAEVWLGEFGWVPMEPTPGRGAPGAEAWTGRPEQQAGSEVGGGPAETLPPAPTTTPGTGPDPGAPGGGAQPAPPPAPTAPGADGAGGATGPQGVLTAVAIAVAVGLGALGAWMVVVAGLRRRRAPGPSTTERVAAAWRSVLDSLGASGLRRRRSETAPAFTRRVGALHPDVAGPLEAVASAADEARFAGHPPDEVTAAAAEVSANTVVATLGARRRGLARLRPLVVPPRRHRPGNW